MLGQIQFTELKSCGLSQKAASAWTVVDDLVGANYLPLVYLGTQVVKGTNHWFIARKTTLDSSFDENIVTLAVNEFNNRFKVVPSSIQNINFDF